MPSVVDPEQQLGGAWTVTRTLVRMLRQAPLHADVEVVPVRRKSRLGHRIGRATAVARSFFSGIPAKVEFSRSRDLLARVRTACQSPLDLVILNGADLLWLLPHLPASKTKILVAHNIEHELFASQIRGSMSSPVAGPLLMRQHRALREFELENLKKIGNAICLSTLDSDYISANCPAVHSMVLPPGFDTPPARTASRQTTGETVQVGMLGNFDWWPNRESLRWFMRDVFPHVTSKIQIHLFGPASDTIARQYPPAAGHGHLDDLRDVWDRSDFMICPIISGGGVSVKLAEAVYNGVPVLGTRFAARGLALDPHPSIVLLDTAREWVDFLNRGTRDLSRQFVPRSIGDCFDARLHTLEVAAFIRRVGIDTISRV